MFVFSTHHHKIMPRILPDIILGTIVSFIPFLLPKYHIIFFCILQVKMGKTRKKNRNKITQIKWPKYQKPKDENMEWMKQILVMMRQKKIIWFSYLYDILDPCVDMHNSILSTEQRSFIAVILNQMTPTTCIW